MNFEIFQPDLKPEFKYGITGPDCQILSLSVAPGERISTEPGSMVFMSPAMMTTVEMGSCSRFCSGESCCKTIFFNNGSKDTYLALTPKYPAKVIPLELSKFKNNKFIAKPGSFMASIKDTSVGLDLDCTSSASCFGVGLGCCRQGVSGQGTAFLAAGGTVVTKVLGEGERIVVDSHSVVGFEDGVVPGAQFVGGCCSCLCGGEGCCYATLQGPGLVVLQSMSFQKYYQAVRPPQDNQEQIGEAVATAATN